MTDTGVYELDELYWFINKKARSQTRENTYIMTMISREPRQIVGFEVTHNKSSYRIQGMVDRTAYADTYCTDGYVGYLDVVFPGRHVYNIRDKRDTHTVESINADLRHYIAGLARRSRCFFRSRETLEAVICVFVDAYNKYGEAKLRYRLPVSHRVSGAGKKLHAFRDLPFSVLDFL